MLNDLDINYLLKRLKRTPDSPAGRSIVSIFKYGTLPGVAAKATGIPHVRFDPIYDEARRIVAAMTLSEADGLTSDEVAIANKALALARAKECAYRPTINEYHALEHLHKAGGSAIKSISPHGHTAADQLPLVRVSSLWVLQENGAVESTSLGGPLFQWTITDIGRRLREMRFK